MDRGTWAKRAGLAAMSTFVCLLGAEGVVRVAGIDAPRWAHANHLESEDKRTVVDAYPDDPRSYFDLDLSRRDIRSRWTALGVPRLAEVASRTPHAVGLRFDEHLCRSDSGEEPAGVARVLVVGDSFTEGQGVRGPDTFSAHLDRGLGEGVDVVNCGRRGYDFPALADTFPSRLDAYEPDLVVYAMVLNDAQRSDAFSARQRYLDDWIVDRRRMLADGEPRARWRSRLWDVLVDRVEGFRVGNETTQWYLDMYGRENAAGWAATQDHIAGMGAAASARGADFVVVLLPLLVQLDGTYAFEPLSPIIAGALAERGVPFHDTTPALLGRPTAPLWVHPMDRHPNERAHQIIADDLQPVIAAMLGARS